MRWCWVLSVPGRPTFDNNRALAVGAGGVIWTFLLLSFLFSLSLSCRFRLKYCLKVPLTQTPKPNHTEYINKIVFLSSDDLKKVLTDCNTKFIVTIPALVPKVTEATRGLKTTKVI